jgi:hypothetical protein
MVLHYACLGNFFISSETRGHCHNFLMVMFQFFFVFVFFFCLFVFFVFFFF